MVKSPTKPKEKTMNTRTSRQTEKTALGFSPELLDEVPGEAKTAQELLDSSVSVRPSKGFLPLPYISWSEGGTTDF